MKNKVNIKKAGSVFYWLFMMLILLIGGVIATAAFDVPIGIKFYTVQSGSMEPSIPTGSLVFVKPEGSYQAGNIITFKSEKDRKVTKPAVTTTHRIVELKSDNGQTVFITKGDANNAPDVNPVKGDLVIGRTVFYLPWIGYLVSYARTMQGLIILIVVPATIIIYTELINIKNETAKLIAKKKQGKLTLTEGVEEKVAEEIVSLEKKDK